LIKKLTAAGTFAAAWCAARARKRATPLETRYGRENGDARQCGNSLSAEASPELY
jgi:hypothetical protein